MTNIAISLATTALPYVVQGVGSWVSNAAKTWVPAAVANNTIESAAFAGSKFFGDHYILGKIGSVAGRAFGLVSAPFVAQAAPVQAGIGLGGQVAGGVLGALVHVAGSYALNKCAANPQPQESAADQFLKEQQLLQNKLQLDALQKINDQLNAATKVDKTIIENSKFEKLAKDLNIPLEELMFKLKQEE